jgi:hypothetical protein
MTETEKTFVEMKCTEVENGWRCEVKFGSKDDFEKFKAKFKERGFSCIHGGGCCCG